MKFYFSHSKLRKEHFLVKFSKSRGTWPPSDARGFFPCSLSTEPAYDIIITKFGWTYLI